MKSFLALVTGLSLGLLSSFAPAMAEGYSVQPGDTLRIEVLEDSTLNRSTLVTPDGSISVPMAGSIKVGGQTVDAVGAAIAAKIAPNFAAKPHVFVSVERLADRTAAATAGMGRGITVYVMGEANKPGKLEVSSGTTVLQAFAEMGGFTKFAATKRIQLRHTDKATGAVTITRLNYDAIEAGSSNDGNVTLKPGDVIVVPQRKLFE